jgi:hypothetical protein
MLEEILFDVIVYIDHLYKMNLMLVLYNNKVFLMMLFVLIDNYVILMMIYNFLVMKKMELKEVIILIEYHVSQIHYNHYILIITNEIYP